MTTSTGRTELYLDEFTAVMEWSWTPYDPGQLSGPPEICYPPEGGVEPEQVGLIPLGADEVNWINDPKDYEETAWYRRLLDTAVEEAEAASEDPRW